MIGGVIVRMYQILEKNDHNFLTIFYHLNKAFLKDLDMDNKYSKYRKLFYELLDLSPEENDSVLNFHNVIHIYDYEEANEYYDSCGYLKPNEEDMYSISFERWEKLLGMEVDDISLESYIEPYLIAIFLWEITFYGFEQSKVKEELDEIKRRLDALESGKGKTIPFEEVLKKVFGLEE